MAASEVVQAHDDISLDKAAASLRAAMLNSFFSKKELKPAVPKQQKHFYLHGGKKEVCFCSGVEAYFKMIFLKLVWH